MPGPGLVIATDNASFVAAMRSSLPKVLILISPPAGPAEMRLVARERRGKPATGLVLLSDHSNIAARILALQLGFDDAIDLSADPIEIHARLSAASHAGDRVLEVSRVELGPGVQVDLRARTLWRDGEAHSLRPRDFELLRFFIDHPGQALTRQQLLGAWPETSVSLRMVDVTVWRLRALVEQDPAAPESFVTVSRLGYRYDPPRIRG